MTDWPVSEKMKPRPVWRRVLIRKYSGPLDIPTEKEIQDAVLVLSDASLQELEPDLYLEAERIFEEASR